ncbi:MAG: TIGR02221 family CRISPR-associated protein [Oscillospiraceae bacterium]|nr:TIGR02221 family CRISPR-associated protein [Oscillospiraceae bacterium]
MANIFMTFIGAGPYEPVNYVLGEQSVNNRFVSKALLEMTTQQGVVFDKLFFFLTDKAKELNWEKYTRTDRITGEEITDEGIEPFLEKRFPDRYEPISIPDGNSDAELLEIFGKIYDKIEPGDHLTIDTTHGFRSLPLLYFPVLRYAKEIKNITIEHIYYGCFLSKFQDAPVIDLKIYDMMLDYSWAARLFVKTGNASEMSDQIVRFLNQLPGVRKQSISAARDLGLKMMGLTNALQTCMGGEGGKNDKRAPTIKYMIKQIDARKDTLSNVTAPESELFCRLLEHAVDSVSDFSEVLEDPVEMGLCAVEWYLERSMIMQGYTALEETITTFFCRMYVPSISHLNSDFRMKFGSFISGSTSRGMHKPTLEAALQEARRKWREPFGDKLPQEQKDAFYIGIVQFLNQIDFASAELDLVARIKEYRNYMNHFGMREKCLTITREHLKADYEQVLALFKSFRERSTGRISAEEAMALLTQKGSGFVNFSNHPSSGWSEEQRAAALELSGGGEITDLPFPQISGTASEEELQQTAAEYIAKIGALRPAAVMCMGETGCSFLVASALKRQGIPVYYSCSDRDSVEVVTENGTEKRSVFRFVRFRSY